MRTKDISKVLESIAEGIKKIVEENAQRVVSVLLNLVENLSSENKKLRAKIQSLEDEVNHFKGDRLWRQKT